MNHFTPDQQQIYFLGGVSGVLITIFLEWLNKKWPL